MVIFAENAPEHFANAGYYIVPSAHSIEDWGKRIPTQKGKRPPKIGKFLHKADNRIPANMVGIALQAWDNIALAQKPAKKALQPESLDDVLGIIHHVENVTGPLCPSLLASAAFGKSCKITDTKTMPKLLDKKLDHWFTNVALS